MKTQNRAVSVAIALSLVTWPGLVVARDYSNPSDRGEGRWDRVEDKAERAWDATKDKSERALDATKETGERAYDATKRGAERAWDATKDTGERAFDATKRGGERAWEGTKDTAEGAYDATKRGTERAWDATKEKAERGYDEMRDKARDTFRDEDRARRDDVRLSTVRKDSTGFPAEPGRSRDVERFNREETRLAAADPPRGGTETGRENPFDRYKGSRSEWQI